MLRRVIVGVISLSLLLSATAAAQERGDLEERLDRNQAQLDDARDQLDEVSTTVSNRRERLAETSRRLERAEAQLVDLRADLAQAREELALRRKRLEAAQNELAVVTARLERAEAELEAQRDLLADRVAAAYMHGGDISWLQVMLESEDIADFLNTNKYVSSVMDNDQAILTTITELVTEITADRAEADRLRDEAASQAEAADRARQRVQDATDAQKRATEEVAAVRAERAELLDEAETEQREVEGHIHSLAEESGALEAELAELARREAAAARRAAERAARQAREAAAAAERSSSSVTSSGGPASSVGSWGWPASCGTVTSRYGYRWGRMHEGVDISCGMGSGLYASRSGVVYATSCGGGYGNCVLINHGDGYVTLYAHQSRIAVSTGQPVSKGQLIGYEGSTGNSTGSHLHFEVRVNGSPRNPCNYIGC